MSEYRILKVDPKPPFLLEYQLIAPNGRLLIEVNQYALDSIINARNILNQESTALHEEIATLQAALSASQAALAEARKVIRNEAAYCEGIIDYANSYAVDGGEFAARAEYLNEIIAKWDENVVDSTESEAPSEVTLTMGEIDWLAKHQMGKTTDRRNWFDLPSDEPMYPYDFIKKLFRWWDGIHDGIRSFSLDKEYDNEVNRAAIEKRRKELESEESESGK